MRFFITILTFFSLFIATNSYSQSTDEQLAVHYFQNEEYEKAAIYYEKLYNKKPTDFYYNYYLKCLIALEDYKSAEKVVKKQIKEDGTNLNYKIDLGGLYAIQGNESKAKKEYDSAIKELTSNQTKIAELARSFMNLKEYEYALATYEKGDKLLRGFYPFNVEKAEVYGVMGNEEKMIDEYLSLIDINPSYIQQVQNALNRNIDFDKESEQKKILKTQLLKRIQKNPNNSMYSEMLIWLYIQEKNFKGGLIQVKALDRREKSGGGRVVGFARLAAANGAYGVAEDAYEYIISLGPDNYYYSNSKIDLLNVMNKKVTTGDYNQEDLTKLQASYYATLDELGKNVATSSLIKELAHLEAYYIHDNDTAIALLEELIEIPRIKPQLQAEAKLLLGDIKVIQNEVWDASLLYSQVEKAYKYDEIGQMAKFKNAKIAYYTGDFQWAKAQLDVLKGSTSKLIANDALDLSLLITDNTGIDTTINTMLMYARADLLVTQNKDEEAKLVLDSINKIYPGHAIEDEILYMRYRLEMKHKDYAAAGEFLKKIMDNYPYDLLGDDALFDFAELNEKHYNNPEVAKDLYQKLITDYKDSLYVVESRKRFRRLRGDDIEKKLDDQLFHN